MDERLVSNRFPFFFRKRGLGIPTDGPNPSGLVVSRHPTVAMNGKTLLVWDHRMAGKEELRQAPVISIFFCISAHTNHEAVVSFLHSEPRRLIQDVVFSAQRAAFLYLFHVRIGHAKGVQTGVQEVRMA